MNPFHKDENITQFVSIFINLTWVSCFLLIIIYRYYPVVGHDFAYIVSHVFDIYLHYRVNGLSIEWYTPSFGGGLPSYAQPQQMQFSLVQLLVFFFNPWQSVLIAMLVYVVTGIFCFYIFAKDVLYFDWRASLLGGLFFVFTGFYIGHMISGAFGFMAFPLLSGIILVLFWRRWSDLLAGVVMGLILASLVYQAGFYVLVIFVLSGGMLMPLLYLMNPGLFSFLSLAKRLLIAGLFITAISASKLYAVYTFMRFFPRVINFEYSSAYSGSILFALVFVVLQFLGTTTLAPMMALTGWNVNVLPGILTFFSGYPISGLWETDNGISPALISVFLFAAYLHIRARRKINASSLSKDKILALCLLLFATWFTVEYSLAKGWFYKFASQLPILESMHINFRFMAAFYFPLALLGAMIMDHWFRSVNEKRAMIIFVALNIVTLVSPLSYFLYTDNVHYRIFDVRNIISAYQQSKQGETFPVHYVADKNTKDWDAITQGATTIHPYEPVFGYWLEAFTPQIHPGPVLDLTNGYFNMTNPASLTFPETNGGRIFSLFAESDRQRLEQFLQRRQVDWHIPKTQILLNYVSAISFCIAVIILFGNIISKLKFRRDA